MESLMQKVADDRLTNFPWTAGIGLHYLLYMVLYNIHSCYW